MYDNVVKIFIEAGMDEDEGMFYCLADDDFWSETQKKVRERLVEELGYEHITQEGGGEGGTEYCYTIMRFGNTYYKMEYSYYSFDGYDFGDADDWVEVKPVKKEIIVYVAK
jgi:hypothetical protein